ncbi:beta-lactamase family protein [Dactylosporangium sp. NBC_01737]|uniref:serine hydrolase domain-containing protein n=1 Tax=Dactylosporangium sp. NBC_01737 TaxID=2975959 RepID=UPI002E0F9710|nr:beta-lactamase family protein [Dactylosporangium sp. NBC_01737]
MRLPHVMTNARHRLADAVRYGLAVLVAGTLAAGVSACTADDDPGPAPGPGSCPGPLGAALEAWGRAGFSGAVAVSTAGRFDCLAGYGSANDTTGARNTADTVYSIGSVTKMFTAASILKLADERKLSLDDRIGTLVPAVTGPVSGATVRHLLLHTSGIGGSVGPDDRPLSRDEAIAAINKLALAFAPGTDDAYSNAGYTLLAIVVEAVSGQSYRDYTVSTTLALPGGRVGGFWDGLPAAAGPRALGYLDDGKPGPTGERPGPHWAVDGNGSLAMTPREVATWTRALITGGLLSPESTRSVAAGAYDVGEGRSHTVGGMVAFDAAVYGKPFVGIAGGGGDVGHNVAAVWIPGRDQVVVVASNRPLLTAEKLLSATISALVTGAALPTPSAPAGNADLGRAVGTYRLDSGGTLQVSAPDNRLTVTPGGVDAVGALFPPGRRFSVDGFRAHEGRVQALLAGQSKEGREERAALERQYGKISDVSLAGTVVADSEMRTYVTVAFGARTVLGWYALNDHGNIEAAELPTTPPALVLVPVGGDRYRPDDPTGTGPDVTIGFGTDQLSITTPAGQLIARRTG